MGNSEPFTIAHSSLEVIGKSIFPFIRCGDSPVTFDSVPNSRVELACWF